MEEIPEELLFQVTTNTDATTARDQQYVTSYVEQNRDAMTRLHEEIIEYHNNNKMTAEQFATKMQIKDEIEKLIRKRRFLWRFKLFATGSTVNLLATGASSDVDLCLWLPDISEEEGDPKNYVLDVLNTVRCILHSDEAKELIKSADYIEASIPIIKIKTHNDIEADLSVCAERFISGLHNSALLRGYVTYDDRFAPFCALMKEWTQLHYIRGPKVGGFNSYAIVLLVVHFFQCGVSPPVFPHLQQLCNDLGPERFYAVTPEDFPDVVDFCRPLPDIPRSTNTMLLSELFFRFLAYYGMFDFRGFAISLKQAKVIPRTPQLGLRGLKYRLPSFTTCPVDIEDPIDGHNPGRTVFAKKLDSIIASFKTTFDNLLRGDPPTLRDILEDKKGNLRR